MPDELAFIEDVAERTRFASERARNARKLEQIVADSDRRRRLYETFLENSPDLAYVFVLDHNFTYANKVLLNMWGSTWDEAIGTSCWELGYAVEQVRPFLDAQRHRLQCDLARDAAYVTGDQKRLVQIVTNLLGNATKYTPAGGAIDIKVTAIQSE